MTEFLDAFPYLNLTLVVKPRPSDSQYLYAIPSSHLISPSYRENRQCFHFQHVRGDINFEQGHEARIPVKVVPTLSRYSSIHLKPSVCHLFPNLYNTWVIYKIIGHCKRRSYTDWTISSQRPPFSRLSLLWCWPRWKGFFCLSERRDDSPWILGLPLWSS